MVRLVHITVDGETFDVDHDGSANHFFWTSGPNAGYGFSLGRSDRTAISEDQARTAIQGFLASVDPHTGYIAE